MIKTTLIKTTTTSSSSKLRTEEKKETDIRLFHHVLCAKQRENSSCSKTSYRKTDRRFGDILQSLMVAKIFLAFYFALCFLSITSYLIMNAKRKLSSIIRGQRTPQRRHHVTHNVLLYGHIHHHIRYDDRH